ncbi:hypothetical protein DASC09_039350 [Saccharomycopsis crataegensis]|uniref:Uncharacterized protein n=1 Tax=Saccharomycopsis crataegensis TaxID=43959 RepID=A0AAV5QNW2_9ASCO|nr:hypothetical protein DASC09_039350 [Saccharomycopsis crataegensis]
MSFGQTPLNLVLLFDGLFEICALFFEAGEGAVALPITIGERVSKKIRKARYSLGWTSKAPEQQKPSMGKGAVKETFWDNLIRNNNNVYPNAKFSSAYRIGKLLESVFTVSAVGAGIIAFIVAIIISFVILFIYP